MPCEALLPRGYYRVRVAETDTTLWGSRPVPILVSSRLLVTPRLRKTRTAGLGIVFTGAGMIITGVALLVHWDMYGDRVCFQGDCHMVESAEATFGGLMLLLGGVMTPIGWGLFRRSPAIDVAPISAPPRPTVRAGLIPFRGGAGLGGALSF